MVTSIMMLTPDWQVMFESSLSLIDFIAMRDNGRSKQAMIRIVFFIPVCSPFHVIDGNIPCIG
jgi:hypothetical protein